MRRASFHLRGAEEVLEPPVVGVAVKAVPAYNTAVR